jgi:hypothetical protein
VGTGVIAASWATFYLARGFDVIATDPAPNAEANLRHFVDTAWPPLATLGVSPTASPEHLWFTADVRQALADADFIQENAPEHSEIKLFAEMDRAAPPDSLAKFSHFACVAATGRDSSKTHRSPVLARLNQPSGIALADASSSQELP